MTRLSIKSKLKSLMSSRAGLRAVVIGLASDITIAAVKFVAASLTGSSAMTSGGVHSLIDACTEVILFYGVIVSNRTATPDHQLGYGREIYFWNFVVAILIFALGSGVTLIGGLRQIMDPRPIEDEWLNYIVLGCALTVEAFALWAAFKQLKLKSNSSWLTALRKRRDNTTLTIIEGDIAALLGLVISACGLAACQITGDDRFDGIASVTISFILAIVAFRLASNSKNLLIGLPVDKEIADSIISEVEKNDKVLRVNGMVSVHLAPEQVLVAISVWFVAGMTKEEVEDVIVTLDESLRKTYPIRALFIEPQTPKRFTALSDTLSSTVPIPPQGGPLLTKR